VNPSPASRDAVWPALAALLRLGLLRFGAPPLAAGGGLGELLRAEVAALLPGRPEPPHWEGLKAALDRHWPPRHGTLADLARDQHLSLADSFLLMLVGEVERSHAVGLAVADLQAPARQARPSVHLAAALLDHLFGPGTLPPLAVPELPLARAGLIRLEGYGPLPFRHLSLPPAAWAVLLDQPGGWPRCEALPAAAPDLLPDTVRAQVPRLADLLRTGSARGLVLRGPPHSGRRLLAQELAASLGCGALAVPVEVWRDEPALAFSCRYARWLPVLQPSLGPGEVWRPGPWPRAVPVVVVLGTDGAVEAPDLLELALPVPDETQRRHLWAAQLGCSAPAAAATALLSGPNIAGLAASARLLARREGAEPAARHVVEARRHLGAERLRLLAQPVERQVDASAIVLPPLVAEDLERLIRRAGQRESLWEGLGATLRQTANSGLRALFVGDSGTGKTLAASHVATRLGAPLYRVDLSAVMNKYIGESEKNLSTLLDMAAAADATLLFDEADALFGTRSEGRDTGERYANMLTNFLLTRIENHPGIVLLTSNNRERIDPAFLRRLDLIVEFPPPRYEERLALWRSHLGGRGPGEAVYELLATGCEFVGGQLRNAVLTAAAAAGGGPITGRHLLTGLLAEYRKIGLDLPARLRQLDRLAGDGNPGPA
jgi:hypothetical protein